MNTLYIVAGLFFVASGAALAWLIATAEPFDDDPQGWPITEAEQAPRQQARDITIGKDQHVGERLDALRRIQQRDVRREEEQRRASARISKGW